MTTALRAFPELTKLPTIYPPRPLGAIAPETVGSYRGFIGQYKFNDIRILIEVTPDGEVRVLSRKREPVVSLRPDNPLFAGLAKINLARGKFHLLDGGLLRNRVGKSAQNYVVLWDILVHDSHYLLGTTYLERYRLLSRLCGSPKRFETESGRRLGYLVAPGLWLAANFRDHLPELFESTRGQDILEGIVLKNPNGKLRRGLSEENNGDWQIRVRKSSARHVF